MRVFSILLLLVATLLADTYPRQPGIDVLHYRFHLKLSDLSDRIDGEARIDLRVQQAGLREIAFDLSSQVEAKGMTVDSVNDDSVGEGEPLSFIHKANRLQIQLTKSPAINQLKRIIVKYHGIPAAGLRIGLNSHKERGFYGLNWPDQARQWLPMIDHPYDKATSEFLIEAPSYYKVGANGLLQEELDLPNGNRLTHWKQSVPIASWLNAIAVARFSVQYFGSSRGVSFSNWFYPQDRQIGINSFQEATRNAFEFFSNFVGPYPYEKLANVQAPGLSGGTEHASFIFYGEKTVSQPTAPNIVVHEIAHQWFGDSVTERDWDDVWLSEGFATYFTLLSTEHYAGRAAFVEGLEQARQRVFAYEKKVPGLPIIHRNLSDMQKVLSPLVYQKAAWVLHMLRVRMGLDKFRSAVQEYYRTYRDRNATTADFQSIMEHHAGEDLSWFFQQWLQRPGSPEVEGKWSYDPASKLLQVLLRQTQADPVYRLALELQIDKSTERMELTQREQSFQFKIAEPPRQLRLDPNSTTFGSFRLLPR